MENFIKELIQKISEDSFEDFENYYVNNGDRLVELNDVLYTIEELKKKYNNGWISCKKRLPNKEEYNENDGRFIVTDGNRRYQGFFDIYDNKFKYDTRDLVLEEDLCVIAWQPLPGKYREE